MLNVAFFSLTGVRPDALSAEALPGRGESRSRSSRSLLVERRRSGSLVELETFLDDRCLSRDVLRDSVESFCLSRSRSESCFLRRRGSISRGEDMLFEWLVCGRAASWPSGQVIMGMADGRSGRTRYSRVGAKHQHWTGTGLGCCATLDQLAAVGEGVECSRWSIE